MNPRPRAAAPQPRASEEAAEDQTRLSARGLTVSYGSRPVLRDLDLDIPADRVTTPIGPNGCGKSTLLKSLCDLLPYTGTVELEGRDVRQYRGVQRARRMSLLPQAPVAPEGLSVAGLVARGRHPYQSWLSQWSAQDQREVSRVLEQTGLADLAQRPLAELSGGQRQRAWIAMALAQDTPILFADEPVAGLDPAAQIGVMRLLRGLARDGRTVLASLHDLGLAARFCSRLVLLHQGRLMADGPPLEVLAPANIAQVFGITAHLSHGPDGPVFQALDLLGSPGEAAGWGGLSAGSDGAPEA